MTLIRLHSHLLRDQVDFYCFLQNFFAYSTLRVLSNYLLDGIVDLNLLKDFTDGRAALAIRKFEYERCKTSQPCTRILSLIISHEIDDALRVCPFSNPSVFFFRMEALFDQSDYGNQQKDKLYNEGNLNSQLVVFKVFIFLFLLIEGHIMEKVSTDSPH